MSMSTPWTPCRPSRPLPTFWPRYNGGTAVEYTVRTECKERQNGEVHLVVEYRRTDNRQLDETYDINWGTNTIILRRGTRTGRCQWHRLGGTVRNDIRWKSFDLAAANQRPLASYLRSRRHAQFRNIILDCDRHRCVLTRDDTTPALEAAHLIPAKDGENDKPANGITLRADLHRLFDAGLFMLDEAGRVVLGDRESDLSDDYCQLLRNARLPQKDAREGPHDAGTATVPRAKTGTRMTTIVVCLCLTQQVGSRDDFRLGCASANNAARLSRGDLVEAGD